MQPWDLGTGWVVLIVAAPFALLLALGLLVRARRGGRRRRGDDGGPVGVASDGHAGGATGDRRPDWDREASGGKGADGMSDGGGDGGGGGGGD